jgi:arylsulfatase A-like enzyme
MTGLSRRDFLKLAALLPAAHLAATRLLGAPARAASPGAPNVLILVFDTLAALHMSLYGYRRETTPQIARFAQQAYVYHNHYAAANFTSPGTASLLTGTLPWTHRAINLHGTIAPELASRNLFALAAQQGYYQTAYTHNPLVMFLLQQFRGSLDALVPIRELCLFSGEYADRLFPNDYTHAYGAEWQYLFAGDNPGSFFLSWLQRLQLSAGTRRLARELGDQFPRGFPNLRNILFILEDALDWVRAQAAALPRPWLNYTHLLPPHQPYTTRRDFVNRFDDGWEADTKPASPFHENIAPRQLLHSRRLYDEYLAYADAEFGRLVDNLQADGVLDNTWLILASDHGESFERGIQGHTTPVHYQPLLRVPLLIRPPGGAPARLDVRHPTSNVDLLPTLMTIMGAPVPPWAEGRPLPPFAAPLPERAIFAVEAKSNAKYAPLAVSTLALVQGDHKFIRYSNYPQGAVPAEMYNLLNDPDEQVDISTTNKRLALELQAEIDGALQRANAPYAR